MRRVLWLTHVYPRHDTDPLGVFLHRLARRLPERDVEVRVLAPAAPGAPEREERDGVEIRRFGYAGMAGHPLAYTGEMHRGAARRPVQFLQFLHALRGATRTQISEFEPDLVHA
ncbi:MAG: glycosyltransferase, partial [Gemmatimonadetes bacterium]|nr:glycosyltransferase [Gemmatimonadota bacterium]